MRSKRITLVAAGLLALGLGAAAFAATAVKPYVVPIGPAYTVEPLFSADDKVPLTGNPAAQYRMVGIPDGLGAHGNGKDEVTLYMNHELGSSVQSEPIVGGAKFRGAFVSRFVLDGDGNPIEGGPAYSSVYLENTFQGPTPTTANATPAFARFCSGFLAGKGEGFDRWIYLTNEESSGSDTHDTTGGVSVAIFDGELHTLPKLGRYSKENTVVQPDKGKQTVIFSMEDGPATLDSQLWMYVGEKEKGKGATVLRRNGLDNGALFVFRSLDPARNSELSFQAGSVQGEWVEIPGADTMTAAQLEAAADAAGAMTFIRPEDGAFNARDRDELFFVTTGGNAAQGNNLGRLYSLQLPSGDPLKKPATLTVVYNADTVIAAGGDIAISPDNVDSSRDYLMINEDGTSESRPVMGSKGRDGSIWRFEIEKGPKNGPGVDASTATRVAQLDPPGRDGVAVGPGVWETSGIIDTSGLFGKGTWLSDVQAHSPTTAPGGSTVTVEDGQLFLLRPAA